MRDQGYGRNITYSKKVFMPLTQLCRDVCHCNVFPATKKFTKGFSFSGRGSRNSYQGKRAGCKKAFYLGDKPELRYEVARKELEKLGCKTTLEYLKEMAALVFKAGLLPHLNPGVMLPHY